MATVYRRNCRSSPYRDALSTWHTIVDLLTQKNTEARTELGEVAGIATSVIADQACKDSPIIVSCNGPQTRIYCIYDDDAIDGSDSNESALGYDPLDGDWTVSLPCEAEDLDWIKSSLKSKCDRITAREKSESQISAESASQSATFEIDVEGLRKK